MEKLAKNAKIVLERFLVKDKNTKIMESPEQMFRRVAKNIAKEDKKYRQNVKKAEKDFYSVMSNLEFLPNIPVIANAGTFLQQLAACFVLPVDDSIEGIFQSVKDMALIQKTGGGTGFSFSRLRPAGFPVGETHGIASGPVSFMKVFDSATGAIKEGGIRRGANMGILNINHPDIEKFIFAKRKGEFTNFNISVALTDKFMNAILKNKNLTLRFNNRIYKIIKARKLFDMICKNAWFNGEPGVLFLDTINKANPLVKLGKIEATNPCGEQPLLPYESCILGSINLEKCVYEKRIDYDKIRNLVEIGIHFLDNCIDASVYPIEKIQKIVMANRKIGLGIMGFANMLIKLEISYNSKQALKLADKIMGFINQKARETSIGLAKIRGVFPNYNKSKWRGKLRLRNATLTTIAPTGTISIIANTSAGIEPVFSLINQRKTYFETLYEINPLFKKLIKKYKLTKKQVDSIAKRGDLKKVNLPENIKEIFISAHEIPAEQHIKMQAIFQKHTDNAVSKTVNLSNNATVEDIKNIYLLAWKLGCKGLTVYRYNSRKKQILSFCKKCKFN